MKPMTKSLHTVTAVVNVARHLVANPHCRAHDAKALTAESLQILGYDMVTFSTYDETIQRCIDGVRKMLESQA